MKELAISLTTIVLIVAPIMYLQFFSLIRSCKRDLTTWNDILKTKEGSHLEIKQKVSFKLVEISHYEKANTSLKIIFTSNVLFMIAIHLFVEIPFTDMLVCFCNLSYLISFILEFKRVYQEYI